MSRTSYECSKCKIGWKFGDDDTTLIFYGEILSHRFCIGCLRAVVCLARLWTNMNVTDGQMLPIAKFYESLCDPNSSEHRWMMWGYQNVTQ